MTSGPPPLALNVGVLGTTRKNCTQPIGGKNMCIFAQTKHSEKSNWGGSQEPNIFL